MAVALEFEHVSFAYPSAQDEPHAQAVPVLTDVCLSIAEGAFALVTGQTGQGKTTLLRLAKPEVTPGGNLQGTVRVCGTDVRELDTSASAQFVAYVFQDPARQVACSTVARELAFGLESLGLTQQQMARRIAETCQFLGITPWFGARIDELSGGQLQVLALASALVMRPRLLLLDEPAAQLDPLARESFAMLVARANRELGTTVVVATHEPRLWLPYATCAYAVEDGRVRPTDPAAFAGEKPVGTPPAAPEPAQPAACELRDLWLRYGPDGAWVLGGLDLSVGTGEVRALVGANGSGKSTVLGALAGMLFPQRGRVRNMCAQSQALLPQDPYLLCTERSVGSELMAWARTCGYGEREARAQMDELGLPQMVWGRHPHDLSGGQAELLALAKLLLTHPKLLVLDEPTKGLDHTCRVKLAAALGTRAKAGTTIIIATHDLAFVQAVAHRVSLVFDGRVISTEPTASYLAGSWLWHGCDAS